VDRIVASILPQNRAMLRICTKLGFRLSFDGGDGVHAELDLAGDRPVPS
jgi:hypothetical protein